MNTATVVATHISLIPFFFIGVYSYSLILSELRIFRYTHYSKEKGNELIMLIITVINAEIFALIVHLVNPSILERTGTTIYSESLLTLAFVTVYLILSGHLQLDLIRFLNRVNHEVNDEESKTKEDVG